MLIQIEPGAAKSQCFLSFKALHSIWVALLSLKLKPEAKVIQGQMTVERVEGDAIDIGCIEAQL